MRVSLLGAGTVAHLILPVLFRGDSRDLLFLQIDGGVYRESSKAYQKTKDQAQNCMCGSEPAVGFEDLQKHFKAAKALVLKDFIAFAAFLGCGILNVDTCVDVGLYVKTMPRAALNTVVQSAAGLHTELMRAAKPYTAYVAGVYAPQDLVQCVGDKRAVTESKPYSAAAVSRARAGERGPTVSERRLAKP